MIRVDNSGSSAALIQVRGLNKTYKRGGENIQVLQGLNLDVDKGDFVAFMIIPSISSPLAPAGSASGSRHSGARTAMIRLIFIVSSSPLIGFSIQAEIGAPDFLATILRLPFRRLVVASRRQSAPATHG